MQLMNLNYNLRLLFKSYPLFLFVRYIYVWMFCYLLGEHTASVIRGEKWATGDYVKGCASRTLPFESLWLCSNCANKLSQIKEDDVLRRLTMRQKFVAPTQVASAEKEIKVDQVSFLPSPLRTLDKLTSSSDSSLNTIGRMETLTK